MMRACRNDARLTRRGHIVEPFLRRRAPTPVLQFAPIAHGHTHTKTDTRARAHSHSRPPACRVLLV
eukprot:369084-Pleurochrysis_carterae.AAC.1